MRIVLIGFIVVLLVLSCGLSVRYNQDARYAQEELNNERYKRMVTEESLQKANIQIDSVNAELKKVQGKAEQMEIVLEKTKAMNADLKSRLDGAVDIKKKLDEKIAELQMLGL